MKKPVNQYIKCPRCELNYILKKDKFCDVCKSEMKAGILDENDFDEMEEGLELCPLCKVNYISEGETMCTTCQEEQIVAKDDEPDWRGFVEKSDASDDEDLDLLPVEEDDEIDEELEGAFAKDLENEFEDEEDEEDNLDDLDDDFDDFDDTDDDYDDEEDEDDYEEDDDDYEDDDDDFIPRKRK